MNLLELHLSAFGPFTNKVLDFTQNGRAAPMTLVFGRNEAGKSSTLRAMSDLRYEIPARSNDDFLHPKNKLRIGAKLTDRDGELHHLVRRKGNKDTLTTYSDGFASEIGPATEMAMAMLRGGMSRGDFEMMYGMDHARLRLGAQDLLQGGGSLGSALFGAATGGQSAQGILDLLTDRAKELYGKGAKVAVINKALRDYTDSQAEMARLAVKPKAWLDAQKRVEKCTAALEATKNQRQAASKRLLTLKDLTAARLPLQQKNEAQRVINGLAGVAVLPDSFTSDRLTLQAKLVSCSEQIAQAQHDIAQIEAELTLVPDDPLALQLRARIHTLSQQMPLLEQAQSQAAQAGLRVNHASREAQDAARAVAALEPSSEGVTSQGLSSGGFGPSEFTLPEEAEEWLSKASAALERLEELAREIRRMQAIAPPQVAAPDSAQIGALRGLSQHMLDQESSVKRAKELNASLAQKHATLAQGLEDLQIEDLNGELPVSSFEVEAVRAEMQHTTETISAIQTELNAAERACQDADARLQSLLAVGEVVTRAQVEAARKNRDEGWQHVVHHLIAHHAPSLQSEAFRGPLPLEQAYQQSVLQADELADAFANNATAAAQVAQAEVAQASAVQNHRRLQDKLTAAGASLNHSVNAWTEKVDGSALAGKSPDEAAAWLEQWALLRDIHTQIQAEQAELDARTRDLEQERQHALDYLASIGHPWTQEGLPKMAQLAKQAEEIARKLTEEQQTAAAAQAVIKERAERLTALQFDLNEAEAAWHKAHARLQPLLVQMGQPADLNGATDHSATYATASTWFQKIRRLNQANMALESARADENALQSQIQSFAEECTNLTAQMGLEDPTTATLVQMQALADRLATAIDNDRTRSHLAQGLAGAKARLTSTEQQQQALAQQLQGLCELAGVANVNELAPVEEANTLRRKAQAQLDQAAAALDELSTVKEQGLAAIEAKVQAEDWSQMDRYQLECEQQIEALQAQQEREITELQDARKALEAIDESDKAALASAQMDAAATTVRNQIQAWAQAKVSSALLSMAIQRFREKAQGPMLSKASGYFRTMTDGDFAGLVSDEDGGSPVLLAQRGNGSTVSLSGLSEGTCDQVYLSLRMSALDLKQQAGMFMPVVLDDVLMTSDDGRAANILKAIKSFSERHQVMIFTHHRHLIDVAQAAVSDLHLVEI